MIGICVLSSLLLGLVQCDLFPLELTTVPEGCYYQGSYYPVGSFNPTPCEYCHCGTSGQAMCAIADCMMPQCADAVHEKDKCCPTCPNGIVNISSILAMDGSTESFIICILKIKLI